jgi:hypothetical protein
MALLSPCSSSTSLGEGISPTRFPPGSPSGSIRGLPTRLSMHSVRPSIPAFPKQRPNQLIRQFSYRSVTRRGTQSVALLLRQLLREPRWQLPTRSPAQRPCRLRTQLLRLLPNQRRTVPVFVLGFAQPIPAAIRCLKVRPENRTFPNPRRSAFSSREQCDLSTRIEPCSSGSATHCHRMMPNTRAAAAAAPEFRAVACHVPELPGPGKSTAGTSPAPDTSARRGAQVG